jgi:Flp pilus assembly protein CpaB
MPSAGDLAMILLEYAMTLLRLAVFVCLVTLLLPAAANTADDGNSTSSASRADDSSTTAEPTVTVVVAKQAIPTQTVIREPEKYFALRSVPVSRVPKECLRSLKCLKDIRVTRAFAEGQPFDANAIESKESLGGRHFVPQPVSIPLRIKSTKITGDVIRPGSKADVVWVYSIEGECGIKTIFTDLPVIAVEKCGTCNDSDTPRTRELLVTLAGSPREAASMRIAAENGEIRLLVKSPGDDPTKEK